MKSFKPLLAGKYTDELDLHFPTLVSTKLDGIRCLIIDGVALSRTLKPIPNKNIQQLLGQAEFNGLDGEIIVGDITDSDCFRNTTSVVMAHNKPIDGLVFHVFDDFSEPSKPFAERLNSVWQRLHNRYEFIVQVHHDSVNSTDELLEVERVNLEAGNEGVMTRDPGGVYKYGRSTSKEQILLKVKRFSDSEAIVTGFEELCHNDNVPVTDALGNLKRSTHKDNKRLAGTLGALLVKDIVSGVEFNVGTGLTAQDRADIWGNQQDFVGKLIKYKFFPVGTYEKPRFPVFLGWRDLADVGAV